jgi:hypothetical protein
MPTPEDITKAAEEAKKKAGERETQHTEAAKKKEGEEKTDEQNLAKGAAAAKKKADEAIAKAKESADKAKADPTGAAKALAEAQALLDQATIRDAIRKVVAQDTNQVIDEKLLELIGLKKAATGGKIPEREFERMAGRNVDKAGISDDKKKDEAVKKMVELLKALLAMEG